MADHRTKRGIEGANWAKEFSKCPACGSKERFFERIVKELKKGGVVGEDWNFYLDMKQGPVFDPRKMKNLLIGAEIPGYAFANDICINCGCIYVVRLTRLTAKKTLTPVSAMPRFNNPLTS